MNVDALQRIVALIDMDCFYCQVEAKLDSTLQGKPVAVVQYNQWQGGGIIAVNYEARDQGVKRGMRGNEAKAKCPDIQLVSVPCVRGKADLTKYRDAGAQVAEVFCKFSDCVQRASIDEAYIDLTKSVMERINSGHCDVQPSDLPNSYVVGYCDGDGIDDEKRASGVREWLKELKNENIQSSPDYKMMVGAVIVEEMRAKVFEETGFHCSAGIAHNKILAKLVAGLHKPKQQTILPHNSVPELYQTIPVYKVRSLGGKLGKEVISTLNLKVMADLLPFTLKELQQKIDAKTGSFLYNIARGIDMDPVTARMAPKSIGCCKNFPGKQCLSKKSLVKNWLSELAVEVSERVAKDIHENKRRPTHLIVSTFQHSAVSKSGPLGSYEAETILREGYNLLKKYNSAAEESDEWIPPLTFLGLSVTKFVEESSNTLFNFFKQGITQCKPEKEKNLEVFTNDNEKNERPSKTRGSIDVFLKKLSDKPSNSVKIKTSEYVNNTVTKSKKELKSESFFEKFLNNRTKEANVESESDSIISENGSEENWVSISELFPNVDEVDEDVMEMLPSPLVKRVKERKKKHDVDTDYSKHQPSTSKQEEIMKQPSCSKEEEIMEQLCTSKQEEIMEQPSTSKQDEIMEQPSTSKQEEIMEQSNTADQKEENEEQSTSKEDESSSSQHYISLTELFPNEHDIDAEVIQFLPTQMADKLDHKWKKKTEDNSFQDMSQSCRECGENIQRNAMQEHLDYHFALKLQDSEKVILQPKKIMSKPQSSSGKRKRGRPSLTSNIPSDKKIRNITSFFPVVPKS